MKVRLVVDFLTKVRTYVKFHFRIFQALSEHRKRQPTYQKPPHGMAELSASQIFYFRLRFRENLFFRILILAGLDLFCMRSNFLVTDLFYISLLIVFFVLFFSFCIFFIDFLLIFLLIFFY